MMLECESAIIYNRFISGTIIFQCSALGTDSVSLCQQTRSMEITRLTQIWLSEMQLDEKKITFRKASRLVCGRVVACTI